MLQALTYELSVLAKAIQHKNLSAAAVHIGLSQPQLSRLVAKIESELGVVILDRTARRKSGWTPLAQELALTFTKGLSRLESEILSLAQEREITDIRMATLEGLSSMALQFTQYAFEKMQMRTVSLDVLDFKDLDSQFLSGQLDLVFTVKAPSKQKHQHMIEVGYQQMEKINTDSKTFVCSPFELVGAEARDRVQFPRTFISNSLALRKTWLKDIGGTGTLPIDAKKGEGKVTTRFTPLDLISSAESPGI